MLCLGVSWWPLTGRVLRVGVTGMPAGVSPGSRAFADLLLDDARLMAADLLALLWWSKWQKMRRRDWSIWSEEWDWSNCSVCVTYWQCLELFQCVTVNIWVFPPRGVGFNVSGIFWHLAGYCISPFSYCGSPLHSGGWNDGRAVSSGFSDAIWLLLSFLAHLSHGL